jgi:hypothetical protein
VILIYTKNISIRLNYVLDFCFKSKGSSYEITTCEQEFLNFTGPKINYSTKKILSNLSILPEGLIDDTELRDHIILKFKNGNWTINEVSDYFSIIFYFLTCYEEYFIDERDNHDRFSSKHSIFSKFNRLDKPNADIIVKEIWLKLNLNYSAVSNNYKRIITFDIDSAWAIKNKSFWRTIGSDIKDKLKGRSLKQKREIRAGLAKDPFDTFDYIADLSISNSVICFFLLGNWGKFDKNINWRNTSFQQLIRNLPETLDIGVHPSYRSYLSKKLVELELNRLNCINNTTIEMSRQHFLKLKLPESYELLESIGIKEDYSMGFADYYGFRSGTSFSYPFFNLEKNSLSTLTIYPISYMDGTLNQYLKLSPEESIKIINSLQQEIKAVGGLFIPLWHNETIGEFGLWNGWRKVFESNFK